MAKKKLDLNEIENNETEISEEHSEEVVTDKVESAPVDNADLAEETSVVAKDTQEESVKEKADDVSENDTENKSVVKGQGSPKKNTHGKKYREVAPLIEKGKEYELTEAIELLKKTSVTKFDGSVEVHINLNVDTTKADQQIRGSVSLPAGLGKEKKVAVVASIDKEKEAKDAGADITGGQDLVEKIEKGFMDFDVLVATPDMMSFVGRIGKILGTKGLMPNPKTGTVTNEVGKAVKDIKKGRVEFRPDKTGIVHAPVGKVSFETEALKENIETFLSAIHHAKPTGVKGTYVKGVHLATSMGPGIKIQK